MASKEGEYQGEKLDAELAHGPVEQRGCTDIPCFLIFVAAVVVTFILAFVGFARGNPKLLAVPYDPDGRSCGIDLVDYPYIYFATPWKGYFNRTICVKSCPVYHSEEERKNITLQCVPNHIVLNCSSSENYEITSNFSFSNLDSATLNSSVFVYNTTGLFGRICFPSTDFLLSKMDGLASEIDMDDLEEWFSDIKTCWPIILAAAGFAIVIGFIFMVLMRWCAGLVTWIAILMWIASFILLGIFLGQRATAQKDASALGSSSGSNPITSSYKALLAMSILSYIFAAFSVMIVFCLFSKINLAIAIMRAAADYIKAVPLSLVVPLVFIFVNILWWAFWLAGAIFLYSVGTVHGRVGSPLAAITWDKNTKYALIYFLFAGLWIAAFIMALCQFILASSCSIWYFAQNDTHAPLSRSVYRAFRYHLGSLGFGAFILAVIQMIRIVLAYVDQQARKVGAYKGNKCLECGVKCLQCYAMCFERCIKFLNKNAYIQIAIQGKDFCTSAKDAFFIVLRNPAKFGLVAGIGEVFIFLGKLFICVTSTFLAYLIIAKVKYYQDNLYSQFLPTLCFAVATYIIGVLFMSVYGMAADTILQCYLVDEEVSKQIGHGGPQHCPQSLHDFVNERVKN